MCLLICAALLLVNSGCRREMYYQPKGDPLKPDAFFDDGSVSRSWVSNTVARGRLRLDPQLSSGKVGTNLVNAFPYPITLPVVYRGQQRFEIYCTPCHGQTGQGNGMIVQRGFPPPPSYHIPRLRSAPVGHFFDVITRGYGVMYSYAQRVEVEDRWAISAYIRSLQLSQNARLQEVPESERAALQKNKP